jgi:hypothetical protein
MSQLWWLMPNNPSYLQGRYQEDHDLKLANSLQDSISKKPITKIGLVE